MEITTLEELQYQLHHYVIDAEVCIERNYTFKQVVITLHNDIQSITTDLFTPQDLLTQISAML